MRTLCMHISIWMFLLLAGTSSFAGTIVVAKTGTADFRSIQDAINSLPDTSAEVRVIKIMNGVYDEKLFIEKHNILLTGESRDGVIITQSIARDEWRCAHNDDWGVATVNINGNDVTMAHLTVINNFGFDWKKPVAIACAHDTTHQEKILRKDGHQMALRTMKATRFKALDCRFSAFGGDTVSPWNVTDGLFYFKDCIMEGGVDFYCPRGWAWAENCRFISHSGPAAIWHDGSREKDSKTVLVNCSFEGFDGFKLGRYHRDAQFYLLSCSFANNMANEDIYQVSTSNVLNWGRRVYYFNCHRKGGDYNWHKDNITAEEAAKVSPAWLFGKRWKID